jgi:hypothetical protein
MFPPIETPAQSARARTPTATLESVFILAPKHGRTKGNRMSLQPFTAGAVAPLVPCETCSWPMRLTLVAPLWNNGDAETHTYECGCCKHRQSFKLALKQYAAVAAVPKSAVQLRWKPRYHRVVSKAAEHGVARSAEAIGLQAGTRYARSIA